MSLFKELIVIDASSSVPLFLQITNAFIQNINLGRFRKGLKLPGSRELGDLLQINRMTVVAAYQELEAQGWIETLPRRGTFVKVNPLVLSPVKILTKPEVFTPPQKTGFSYEAKQIIPAKAFNLPPTGKIILHDGGFPDVRLAPIEDLGRRIRSLSRMASNKKFLMYGNAQGTLLLRETLAAFLCDTRGLSITADNILITKGAQMGIYITSSILFYQKTEIIVGTPGYAGANSTFLQANAKLNHVPVREDGIDVDEIERICRRKKIKAVYVIPHHHHPTTVTLTPEKRIKLLELAARYRFAIIEDDYDYDFQYAGKPMMPMASLDRNGNVIYIGTLTKSLAPAIRLGFIVAPTEFIRSATYLRRYIDSHGDSLIENAIAEMFKDGTITRHLKKSITLYRDRRDHFCDLLQREVSRHISFKVPEGGMLVWATFLKKNLQAISAKAFTKGLIIGDGKDYDTERFKYNSVGLGFASLNFKEQEKAVDILSKILNQ